MDARAKDGAIRNQVGMLAMSPIGLDEEQNATVDFFGTLKARQEGDGFEGSVFVPQTAQTLQTETGRCQIETNYISHCLNAGGMGRIDYESETLVAHGSLKVGGGKSGQGYPAAVGAFGVRRLTPVECEKLQGFEPGYTALDKAADGPRYKALGNSMAVPVIRWIIERIAKELDA